MGFHEELTQATADAQQQLLTTDFVAAAMAGELSLDAYRGFLVQAYHHVKHTVPLLMATGARLDQHHEWLRAAVGTYISEETGHQEWILNDIEACGGDKEAVRAGLPDLPCEVMVGFAYDVAQRRNPLGFFGMVHVLEGTSVRGATTAASALQRRLGLPDAAFTYLTSHGDLDQDHVKFFASLMDRIDDEGDRRFIVHCARRFFRLYGDVFRALPTGDPGRPPRPGMSNRSSTITGSTSTGASR